MEMISSEKLDSEFKHEVAARPGGENIKLCFACGTCTAGCPVAEVDSDFNPRKIIRQVLVGTREEVLSSPLLWMCVQCHSCTARCPQNVKFREIVRALRELAVEQGFADSAMLAEVDRLGELFQKLRGKMSRALATDTELFEKLKNEVQQLIE